jgi:hypothetical protein
MRLISFAVMPLSVTKMQSNSNGVEGGGASISSKALFALAHLATMSEEERGVFGARVSPINPAGVYPLTGMKDTSKVGPFEQAGDTPPATTSPDQRPAKKRIMTDISDVAHLVTESKVPKKISVAYRSKKSSTPSSSYFSESHPNYKVQSTHQHQRKGSNTFKIKADQPSFPLQLMAIMSSSQNKEYIGFLSDEQSFIIINPDGLQKCVLHHHFETVPTYDQFLNLLALW